MVVGTTTTGRLRALRLVEPPDREAERTPAAPTPARVPPAYDDSELLAAVRAGDPAVAAAFHDRVRPQVDRTIRRLLGPNDPDREDVVQIALVEIVTTIDRYRGDCSLDSWTSTLAAHVAYKKVRRRQIERRLFAAEPSEDVAPTMPAGTTPEATASAAALLDRALGHLSKMDPSRAWAFVLHDVWGYDLREAAQIMEISIAAAQSRLVRGRRELHARIADDPELADHISDVGESR